MTDHSSSTPVGTARKLPTFTRKRCKQCGICTSFCPKDAIDVDEDGNPYLKDPEACTGCGLCELLCPDFGVKVNSDGRNGNRSDSQS